MVKRENYSTEKCMKKVTENGHFTIDYLHTGCGRHQLPPVADLELGQPEQHQMHRRQGLPTLEF
jgi:hypothetical protein